MLGVLASALLLLAACGDDGGSGDDPAQTDTTTSAPVTDTSPSATDAGEGAELSADVLRSSLETTGIDVESLTLDDGTATVVIPPDDESEASIVCAATEPFVDEVVIVIDGVEQIC